MADYTLYGHPRSGNAYKTALMLALTGTAYDFELVDIAGGGNLDDPDLDRGSQGGRSRSS